MNKIFAIALAATALLGCTQNLGEFSILTTKTMDVAKQLYRVDDRQKLQGSDSVFQLYTGFMFSGVHTAPGGPNIKEAIDNAIESDPRAVALSDATITKYQYLIPIIDMGIWGFEVEGNAVYEEDIRRRRR